MRPIHCAFLFICLILMSSCGEDIPEGFLGSWKGKTTVISNGQPVTADISLEVEESTTTSGRTCELKISSLQYDFAAVEIQDMLIVDRQRPSNVSDSLIVTYISGNGEIATDTSIYFEAEVIYMQGTSILASQSYELVFERDD